MSPSRSSLVAELFTKRCNDLLPDAATYNGAGQITVLVADTNSTHALQSGVATTSAEE